MSWRDKLLVERPGSSDKSDRTPTFVTFVTNPLNDEVSSVTPCPDPPPAACKPERGVPWAEWKTAALNRLFQEQGVTGEPGRIRVSTVLHGERNVSEVTDAAQQSVHPPSMGGGDRHD